MSACSTSNPNQHPLSRSIINILLCLMFLWAFLGTIDGPWVQFQSNSAYVSCISSKAVSGKFSIEAGKLSSGTYADEPLRVHPSFLLFDFKQNLRHWPNVASDITRSPPSLVAA